MKCPRCGIQFSFAPGAINLCGETTSCYMLENYVPDNDIVNHPKHYTSHPSGIECIQVTEHMNFNLGNCVKYIWRNGDKGDRLTDLLKAQWYLAREIALIQKNHAK